VGKHYNIVNVTHANPEDDFPMYIFIRRESIYNPPCPHNSIGEIPIVLAEKIRNQIRSSKIKPPSFHVNPHVHDDFLPNHHFAAHNLIDA